MVQFMAENRIGSPEEMKGFDRLGYGFRADLSDEKNLHIYQKMKSAKRVTARRQCLVITRFFHVLYDRLFPVYFPF